MQNIKKTTIGLRELRENTAELLEEIEKGNSFTVFRRSEPLFKISPIDSDSWEEVIDFTKVKKGGVNIDDILSRL